MAFLPVLAPIHTLQVLGHSDNGPGDGFNLPNGSVSSEPPDAGEFTVTCVAAQIPWLMDLLQMMILQGSMTIQTKA